MKPRPQPHPFARTSRHARCYRQTDCSTAASRAHRHKSTSFLAVSFNCPPCLRSSGCSALRLCRWQSPGQQTRAESACVTSGGVANPHPANHRLGRKQLDQVGHVVLGMRNPPPAKLERFHCQRTRSFPSRGRWPVLDDTAAAAATQRMMQPRSLRRVFCRARQISIRPVPADCAFNRRG